MIHLQESYDQGGQYRWQYGVYPGMFRSNNEASGTRTPLLLFDHGQVYFVLHGVRRLPKYQRVRSTVTDWEAYLSVEDFNN